LASLAGAIVLGQENPGTFALKNNASTHTRLVLFSTLAGGIGVGGFAGLLWGLFGKERGVDRLSKLARICAPLAISYPITALLQYRVWRGHELQFLVALGVIALLFERCCRLSLATIPCELIEYLERRWLGSPSWLRRGLPLGLVVLAASAFSAFVAYFSIQQHHRLATMAYDLGIYDNLMYNAMHGEPFHSPVLLGPSGGNYLAGHAELAMLLFVPIYALKPGPENLLILQAVMLGFAAVPLYGFVSTLLPRFIGVLVAWCYLLYAPLHGPAFYDFHWLPLAMFFHFSLYFSLVRQKGWLTAVCLVVLILIREDVSIGLTLLGVFLTVTRLRPRLGPSLVALGVTAFLLLKFVLMPWAGPWWFADMYKDLVAKGEQGYGSVVLTTVINPVYFMGTLLTEEKLVYALHLYAPLVFLPLRWPALAMLSAAGFFFTLMTTGYAPTLSISFQYTTHWIPYLFATVCLAIYLQSKKGVLSHALPAALALFLGVTTHSLAYGALLQNPSFVGGFARIPFQITKAEERSYRDLLELIHEIPDDASVAATEDLVPHVSTRRASYTLRKHHGKSDFLLINRNALGPGEKGVVRDALKHAQYGLVGRKGKLFLLGKGKSGTGTDAALRELGVGKADGK
jgi:uncharacterized membrane protein